MTTPPPPGTTPPPPPPTGTGPLPSDEPTRWWSRPQPLWLTIAIAVVALTVGVAIGTADPGDDAASATTDTTEPAETERDTTEADDVEQEPTTTTEEAPTTTRPPRTTTTPPTTSPEEGTRDNPYEVGTPLITTDGVEVTVTGVNPEAAAAIAAENRFNDPEPDGMRYVMVNLAVTNSSDEPIRPWLELQVNAIGSLNQVHETCRAVLPDSIRDAPELYPGGAASGNECVVVPEEELLDGSLLIMVAPRFGDPVFIRP